MHALSEYTFRICDSELSAYDTVVMIVPELFRVAFEYNDP